MSLVVAVFFLLVGSALHVRSAIDDGALSNRGAICLDAAGLEKLASDQHEQIEDWFVVRQIHSHYYAGTYTGPNLGWRGALIWVGTRIAMSASDRSLIANRQLASLQRCAERGETT